LLTSEKITVRHLEKFIAKKLRVAESHTYQLYLPHTSQPLSPDMMLGTIYKELWGGKPDLSLYYKLEKLQSGNENHLKDEYDNGNGAENGVNHNNKKEIKLESTESTNS
jgi:hypothetical protein